MTVVPEAECVLQILFELIHIRQMKGRVFRHRCGRGLRCSPLATVDLRISIFIILHIYEATTVSHALAQIDTNDSNLLGRNQLSVLVTIRLEHCDPIRLAYSQDWIEQLCGDSNIYTLFLS
jgi:hypothetical protein